MSDLPYTLLLGGDGNSIALVSKFTDTLQDRSKPFIVGKPPANARGVTEELG